VVALGQVQSLLQGKDGAAAQRCNEGELVRQIPVLH
jgi:hypothetical protein